MSLRLLGELANWEIRREELESNASDWRFMALVLKCG